MIDFTLIRIIEQSQIFAFAVMGSRKPMRPPSPLISELLLLPFLFYLECNHYSEKLSDNLNNSLPLDGGGFTQLNFAFGEPCVAGIQQGKGGGAPLPFIPSRQGRGQLVAGQFFPYIFLRKGRRTSGMKFA